MTEQPAPPASEVASPGANITALVSEAMTKSGIIWVEIPGDRAWPVWHAWVAPTAYVVNGPGEQHLPWLPEEVVLVLRSQDTGGRLLRVRARTRVLADTEPQWETATTALSAGRLNAPPGVLDRWRYECAVTALTPYGNPVSYTHEPGSYTDGSGAAAPPVSRATTSRWRPWHLFGRPKRRRGTR